MKVICVGRNYVAHAIELKNEVPTNPVVFLKPDTAVLKPGEDFYLPNFSKDVHHELELIVKINKPGKNIEEQFAHRYYDEVSLGIDFTARDLQEQCKSKYLPWEIAKAFDGSAPIGKWMNKSEIPNLNEAELVLKVNDTIRQNAKTNQMIFNIDFIISYVSKFFTLKTGDIIFTGTPSGVAAVKKGDVLKGYFNNIELISVNVK
jgi:2-keto-4-pentenoate hydratase/2-oxohepta-3-ene-1,7-dioic acid hydratase in catechol pathway